MIMSFFLDKSAGCHVEEPMRGWRPIERSLPEMPHRWGLTGMLLRGILSFQNKTEARQGVNTMMLRVVRYFS